ncbi:vacuolar segregation protein pep7-like [Plakobranchus ocellatus]|uniref:Vacuolar segregation protein pep7-like n=1 Tax=Plakobranchus ocellatus TaxID=259542 RepID=A0AAV3XVT8_9GAST|nr:vacuolar segregation protein pep7-like [Plakobranchus ocellatus]
MTSWPDNLRNKTGLMVRAAMVSRIMCGHVMASPFPLSNRATRQDQGGKTQRIANTLRQEADLVCAPTKETVFSNMYCWTHELLPPV